MTDLNIATGEHRDLLDIIDNFRSQGVSRYVDLPEIIVCGDQSAGKSSVLEAISGMKFPTKDSVCTRFATELILRRGREVTTKVSITPGESRFGEDVDRLKTWQPKASIEEEGLDAVTEEAKLAMAHSSSALEFYEDILRIELTGPEQPHLTMVDLPGLFRRGNKEQSEADVHLVRSMVKKFMARPRSIILTVVSAKYDYVLQDVTSMANDADPDGLRTIGLITKPDTLPIGSDSESYFIRLAQNREQELQLGWHVLKNRKFEERHVTLADRDAIESEFFSQGLWSSILSTHCGVASLRTRLSAVLRDQIIAQLPSLERDVEDGIRDCTEKLERLGPVRRSEGQQLSYLLRVSEDYTTLISQAVDGTYTHPFFGNRNRIDKFNTRLRALVRSRLRQFEEDMRLRGQSQYIVDSESESEVDLETGDLPRISRSEYIEDVADQLKFSKGRELPGLFNPLIVSDLFIQQREPWERITRILAQEILEDAHLTTQLIIEEITPEDVSQRLLRLIRQEIEKLKVGLDAKVEELLTSAAQHPITNNPQLTENVHRIQQTRRKRSNKKLIRKTFGSDRFKNPDSKLSLNLIEIMDLMEEGFEPDMERFGSALAVDYMQAYYKVAMSRFVDDVSTFAVENCLLSKLPMLFRSGNVIEMSDEERSRLAGETEESALERAHLEAKREILETGLQSLKSLHRRGNSAISPKRHQLVSESSEQESDETPSRSDKASDATDDAELASPKMEPDDPTFIPKRADSPPLVNKWQDLAEARDSAEDSWFLPPSKDSSKKIKREKKASRRAMFEEPIEHSE